MKKLLSIHIWSVLLSLIAGLMFSSCIYDKYYDEDGPGLSGDELQFVLRVNAVGAGTSQQATDIVETVKSLRVIMIDECGRLDINEKMSLPVPEYIAKNFNYIFVRNMKPGNKRVFLIANEESVGAVSLTDREGLPKELPLTSLTAMLEYFKVDSADDDAAENYTGNIFANALNRVYFKNDYSKMVAGNKIALPYSAYYDLKMSGDDVFKQMERTLYLVPVAAKFDFVFTNYRKYNAYIDDIIISSINSHNYLNAQLHDSEKWRKFPDETADVWWIDWLEKCALGSQSEGDTDKTDAYNGKWGWISRYSLPVEDEPMVELQLNKDNSEWKMNGLVDKKNPSVLCLGPYYVPESINRPSSNPDSGIESVADYDGSQEYSLTFKVHDATESEVTTLSGYVIDTLKALFRATHTIIYVELYESKAEIYAEIYPWIERSFKGYVQQDEDYE